MNQNRQIIVERQKNLLALIREKGSIQIHEASVALGVSEITIRRDLITLEKKYMIERFHGGAKAKNALPENDTLIQDKAIKFEHEKELIGKAAASIIPDHSTIFLGSGTTALFVIKNLYNKHVNIITNNSYAPTCPFGKHMEVILCGGECRHRTRSLIGPYAEHVISSVYADFCVLGANGLTPEQGITTAVYHEARIYQLMVQQCTGKVVIITDGSKIGKSYPFVSIGIQKIDILITDSSANFQLLNQMREAGIEVILID